jgi:DNA-binding IclR family transcriptional regulator
MTPTDRSSAERLLDLVEALAAYPVAGVSNSALAKQLECAPSWVSQRMPVLIKRGWVRKDENTGLFHPTAGMARVFGRVMADINAAEQRLSDIKHSFAGALAR